MHPGQYSPNSDKNGIRCKKHNNCGVDTTIESNMTIFHTSEGLVAIFTDSFNINKINLNINNNIDNSQAIVQLQLAENDYHLRSTMKLHFRWNLQHC